MGGIEFAAPIDLRRMPLHQEPPPPEPEPLATSPADVPMEEEEIAPREAESAPEPESEAAAPEEQAPADWQVEVPEETAEARPQEEVAIDSERFATATDHASEEAPAEDGSIELAPVEDRLTEPEQEYAETSGPEYHEQPVESTEQEQTAAMEHEAFEEAEPQPAGLDEQPRIEQLDMAALEAEASEQAGELSFEVPEEASQSNEEVEPVEEETPRLDISAEPTESLSFTAPSSEVAPLDLGVVSQEAPLSLDETPEPIEEDLKFDMGSPGASEIRMPVAEGPEEAALELDLGPDVAPPIQLDQPEISLEPPPRKPRESAWKPGSPGGARAPP